jgi:hypothetical protein
MGNERHDTIAHLAIRLQQVRDCMNTVGSIAQDDLDSVRQGYSGSLQLVVVRGELQEGVVFGAPG